MDETELTKEEKLERRKAQIELNKKKRNTTIFLLCTSLIQILVTLVIIVAFFFISLFIVVRVFDPQGETAPLVMQGLMFVEFIAGLILGFMAFTAIVRWIIKKFQLEGKIKDDVLARYKKVDSDEKKRR